MRVLVVLLGAGVVLGAFACGSTNTHPFSELAPNSGGGGTGVSSDASDDASGRTCYDETQARPSEDCKCNIPLGLGAGGSGGYGISVELPCGYGVCSSGTGQEAICTNIATVVYVPGCPPLDTDAGTDGGAAYRLPPCDAGSSRTPDADAGANADAAADADAGTDADADADAF